MRVEAVAVLFVGAIAVVIRELVRRGVERPATADGFR
jgi:hypothetical protein